MAATCTVTATITDPSGASLLGNALVRFRLRNYTGFVPVVSGTSVLCETQIDAYPNPAGAISQILTCNTAISPINTFYTVEFWNQGRIVTSANYYFNANTSLNTASNINPAPAPAGPNSIIFENNSVLNSSQTLLNLTSTQFSITDFGNGQLDLEPLTSGGSPVVLPATGMGFYGPYPALGPTFPFYATNIAAPNPIALNINQISVFLFYLPFTIPISKVAFPLATPGAPGATVNFGIYTPNCVTGGVSTKLLDSGAIAADGAADSVVTVSITTVTLPAGSYAFTQSTSDTSVAIPTVGSTEDAGDGTFSLNAFNPVAALASNVTVAGVMPATLGTLTAMTSATATPIALPFFSV